jgi:hypothetical protein
LMTGRYSRVKKSLISMSFAWMTMSRCHSLSCLVWRPIQPDASPFAPTFVAGVFCPFRRGRFQYGLLHFGQTRGSSVSLRGTHWWPQRSHS